MLYVMEAACVVLSGGNIVKYDIEERPECSKLIKTLYRRSMDMKDLIFTFGVI